MHREYGSEQQTRSWLSSNILAVLGLVSRTGQQVLSVWMKINQQKRNEWGMGGHRGS